jgi:hypothetical protein
MTRRRVRLGIGLDQQKLSDTIRQTFDSFKELPGLSIDAHTVENGWLHLTPKASEDAAGNLTHVIHWLLTFGYPGDAEPPQELTAPSVALTALVKLANWQPGLYVSYWLPAETPADDIAALAIALIREVQGVPESAHVEIALEYGI